MINFISYFMIFVDSLWFRFTLPQVSSLPSFFSIPEFFLFCIFVYVCEFFSHLMIFVVVVAYSRFIDKTIVYCHVYDYLRFAVAAVVQRRVVIYDKFPEQNGKYFRCPCIFNVAYESLKWRMSSDSFQKYRNGPHYHTIPWNIIWFAFLCSLLLCSLNQAHISIDSSVLISIQLTPSVHTWTHYPKKNAHHEYEYVRHTIMPKISWAQ